MVLFAARNGSTVALDSGGVRLYRCKFWQGGTLVRDFQPVLDENGVACLYDAVTDELFYNAGSGSFVAGPAV